MKAEAIMIFAPTALLDMAMELTEMKDTAPKRWVAWDTVVGLLDKALEDAKRDREAASQDTIDWMADNGMSKLTVLGKALRIESMARAKVNGPSEKVDPDGAALARLAVLGALRNNGMDELIKAEPSFNMNSISAYVREQQDDLGNFDIPDDLAAALTITTTNRIQGRKA